MRRAQRNHSHSSLVRPAFVFAVLGLLAVDAVPALAQGPRDAVADLLRQRAERAPAPRASAPDAAARGIVAGERLFFMTGADNSPCVRGFADIDGDGKGEVLAGIDESGTDNVFLLSGASSGAATVLWSIETADGASGGSPYGDRSLVPVGDTDGNGHPNLLLGTAWGGRTAYELDGLDGSVIWKFDTYLTADSGWVYSLALMDDVTGDTVPDAAFGVGSMSDSVYLVDGAAAAGQAPVEWRYPASDGVLAVHRLGDVGGDASADLLAAVGDFGEEAVCLDGGAAPAGGQELWSYPAGSTVYAVASMPDLTTDGLPEALAVIWTQDGSAVRCLNGATGALVWQSTTVTDYGVMVDLLEDIDGDAIPEVVVSSFENAVSVLDGKDGSQVWKTTVGTLNGGDVWTARAIGDLSGDGHEDVVAGSFDYHVYAMDGVTGEVLWAYDTGNRVFSVHPVADLTGDGHPEVAVGTQDTNSSVVVHVLDGGVAAAVFVDGFESGDISAWSVTFP